MSVEIKLASGVTCVWGSSAAGTVAQGIIERCQVATDGQLRALPNADGETVGVVFFDNTDTVDLQVYCNSGATKPSRGDSFTAGGVTGYVLNAVTTWSGGDFKRMSVRASKWVNIA